MLSRPSGSREDAALSRVVTRVLAGTHTTTEAIVAEPSINSHDDTERRSYFRKVKRHVFKHQQEAAQEAAAGTQKAFVAAAQKAASVAAAAAVAVAAAAVAAEKYLKAQPVETSEEGTRKSRKTANMIVTNKAAKKRRVTKGFKEACLAYAACKEAKEMTAVGTSVIWT